MSSERGEFTPVEVTKLGQLEHLLDAENHVREVRTFVGGLDTLHRFDNPDFRAHNFDEPPSHEVVFDKALLRGMRIAKKALHDDIVYENGEVQRDKKMIVDGLIEAYDSKK